MQSCEADDSPSGFAWPFLGDKLEAKGDALFTGTGLDSQGVCILDRRLGRTGIPPP